MNRSGEIEKVFNKSKLDDKIEDINNLRDRNKLIVILLISTVIILLYGNYTISNILTGSYKILANIFLFILTIISVITALYLNEQKSLKPEKAFLIIGILFCILFCLAMPMSKGHDETIHALRIYDYSQGNLVTNGVSANIPQGVANAINNKSRYSDILNNEKTFNTNTEYENFGYRMSTYSPITYLPQIVGISVGKVFTNNAMIQLYIARLFNIITCITMIYFAIKIIPFEKNLLFLIALIPIAIEGYTTLSADGIAISSIILFISYILKIKYDEKEKIAKKQVAILTVLSIVIAISKTVYLPIVLLLYIIPKEKYKSNKYKVIVNSCIFIISTIIDLLWFKYGINSEVLNANNLAIEYILTNPIGYIQKIICTIINNFSMYFEQLFGGTLEWNETIEIRFFPYIIFTAILLLTARKSEEKIKTTICQKILILFIIASVILLVFTSMFVSWSDVDKFNIQGVQGRYLLPLLPLLIVLVGNKNNDNQQTTKFISNIILIMQVFVILNIFVVHM